MYNHCIFNKIEQGWECVDRFDKTVLGTIHEKKFIPLRLVNFFALVDIGNFMWRLNNGKCKECRDESEVLYE